MPSADFMRSVLETPAAQAARDEEAPVQEPEESAVEEVEAEEDQPDQDAGEEGAPEEADEEESEDAPEEEEGEAEEEPQAAHEDESLYGQFPSLEELRRGYDQTRAYAKEQSRARADLEREVAEMRQALAYMQGAVENRGAPGQQPSFEEWAEGFLNEEPEQGMLAARQMFQETGDYSFVQEYERLWAERDPYAAAKAGVFNEWQRATVMAQQQEQGPPEPSGNDRQQVVAMAYQMLAEDFTDLAEGSPVLGGTIQQITGDEDLHSMLRSADMVQVTRAIMVGRERHLAEVRAAAPRRASRASQNAVAADKAAGRVATGNGSDRRPAPPSVADDPTIAPMMDQFAEWGMLRNE